ncbi:hypothetical protein LINPERHAP2_LOCUS36569, partial [Linum perenne]
MNSDDHYSSSPSLEMDSHFPANFSGETANGQGLLFSLAAGQ